jgi:hypothetical protein
VTARPNHLKEGKEMKTREITVEQFHAELKAQGVPLLDLALICPMCGTVQSARSLIVAGAGKTFEDVEKYLGFSCVGRFDRAPKSPRQKPDGKPCDWTLGGFFTFHELAVITPEGEKKPRFEVASPEQAQALANINKGGELI